MMRAFFSGIVLSVVMASGCANVPDDDDVAEDLGAETDAELRSQPTDPVEPTRPRGDLDNAAARRTCFVCDLDPSVTSCSSIPSTAQHRCNRACFECVEINGNEECFFGSCEPLL
ncbi:MAG: hypothetical protein KBG48_20185 [Kofleriaceae bacterium]|nr:hypothetical protein [Kofleriaceae bacterium]MBP9169733.1 hypothetical protein [Kofleriaceae bacterium]MBP9858149.1 hypothetical protein [Kofleriaceae bacterium]